MQEADWPKDKYSIKGGTKILGVLGIIQIQPVSYLLVITEHQLVCELSVPKRTRIYEITETKLIKLNNESWTQNKEYEEAIIRVMKCGFYYSPDTDLTTRHQPTNDAEEETWVHESEKLEVWFILFNQ